MTVDVGLAVVFALLAVAATLVARDNVALRHRVELLERRLDRLSSQSGTQGPAGELVDVVGTRPDGSETVIGLEHSDRRMLLAFLSSSCATCAGLWQQFQQRGSTNEFHDLDVVVVTKQPPLDDAAQIASLAAPGGVDVVMSSSAWDDYDVPGSPYVMVVDGASQSVLAERGVASWTEVEQLLQGT